MRVFSQLSSHQVAKEKIIKLGREQILSVGDSEGDSLGGP